MSGNGNGHSWSKFCWRDWQNDRALRVCSLAARGFWMECLAAMHEGEPIGHLTVNGKPMTLRQMAVNAACTEKVAKACLAELEEAGVFSLTSDGCIYSRRMVRDAAASEAGREHVKKRWDKPDPNSPPNRGNGIHPNSPPTREARSPPITKSLEVESEVEPEEGEKESNLNNLSYSRNAGARGSREQGPAAISVAELEPEDVPNLSDILAAREAAKREMEGAGAAGAQVRRAANVLAMRIPFGEVRSVDAQLAALQPQPQVVGADVSMGLRWQPCDPVRSVDEQLAILRASS